MNLKNWAKLGVLFMICLTIVCWFGFQPLTGTNDSFLIAQTVESSPPNVEGKPDDARLIDIKKVNPKIALDIRYATTNNFLKRKLYRSPKCALRVKVAEKLSKVQADLETIGLGLKVFDCYRPLSVTKQMWAVLPDERYVANPARGSRHNRGAAVDLTIVDLETGKALEMPSEFDEFKEIAHRDNLDSKPQARSNSRLLEIVMAKHGFVSLITEWWHFDSSDWENYGILDVSLDRI